MYRFLDNKDYIKYIPVCSKCGESIQEGVSIFTIETLYQSDSGYKCKDYEVYPSVCKKCGAHFEYIVYTAKPEVIKCEI